MKISKLIKYYAIDMLQRKRRPCMQENSSPTNVKNEAMMLAGHHPRMISIEFVCRKMNR